MGLNNELKHEVATIAKDVTRPVFGGILMPNDETLLSRGGGYGLKIYDQIERDTHAFAVLQKRKMALIAREWEVDPASTSRIDKKAAELVKNQLTNLAMNVPDDEILPGCSGFDQMCLNMLDAILKGFAVGETIWDTDGSEIVASEVRAKEQRRFWFTPGTRGFKLNLKTWQNLLPGEPVPPRKFIVHSFGAKDGDPYGLGLGTRLFWPVYFKRQDITFWLTFVDKFAAPTAKGTYPSGATPEDKNKLLAALNALSQDTGIIVPEGMAIELIEAARSGSIDSYEKLARYMDEQISECVLGETGSTNQSNGGGSRARDQVGNEVRLELVKADSDLLCATINTTLVKWITILNLPGATPPKVWRDCKEPVDLKNQAERDGILSKDAGVKFTTKYFVREYGFEEGDIESVGTPIPPGAGLKLSPGDGGGGRLAFAEPAVFTPAQQSVEGLKGASFDQSAAAVQSMLDQVQEIIAGCASFEEAKARLADAYDALDESALGELLAQAMFSARAAGMIDAQ